MKKLDDLLVVAIREWVEKAENDLKACRQLLRAGSDAPTDVVCYHAQQCVEKYMKAALVTAAIDFPKTHDIAVLFRMLPKRSRPSLAADQCRRLTRYATATRYPGSYPVISLTEARQAVGLARVVRRELRVLLPGKSLVKRLDL